MISRVADHCFWLGRYVERAECTARLLSVTEQLSLDGGLAGQEVWPPLVIVAGEQERFEAQHGSAALKDGRTVMMDLTWNAECSVSVVRSLDAARDNARAIRETISLEMWQTINQLWVWLHDGGLAAWEANPNAFYTHITRQLMAVGGELRATMLRDEAFGYISTGTLLERAGQTARTLDVYYHALERQSRDSTEGAAMDAVLLWGLLRACAASEPFMKRYHGRVSPSRVGAFLLLERALPRSVRFAITKASEQLAALRPESDLPGQASAEALETLASELEAHDQGPADAAAMHALLTHVVETLGRICTTLGQELFGYPAPSAQSQMQNQ